MARNPGRAVSLRGHSPQAIATWVVAFGVLTGSALAAFRWGLARAWVVFSLGWLVFVVFRSAFSAHRWRMFNWLGFSVLLALFPILTVVLFGILTGGSYPLHALGASTEVYLFAAILAAATLGELVDVFITIKKSPSIHPAIVTTHVLVTLVLMLMLGMVFSNNQHVAALTMDSNLVPLTAGLVPITVAMSAALRLSLFGAAR